jgi:hypothetical protein
VFPCGEERQEKEGGKIGVDENEMTSQLWFAENSGARQQIAGLGKELLERLGKKQQI